MLKKLEEASPTWKGMKEMMDKQYNLVLKPIGDMMSMLMRPYLIIMMQRLRMGLREAGEVFRRVRETGEGFTEEDIAEVTDIVRGMLMGFGQLTFDMNQMIRPIAAEVAGFQAGLEVALIELVKKMLLEKGFTFVIPPELVTQEIIDAAGFAPAEVPEVYRLEEKDLYLIATAEIPILGIHKDEILTKDQLPDLYLGFSSCFRVEAGAYGKKAKGLFRTHEFDKLEMFTFCEPKDSENLQKQFLDYEEKIFQALEIPYRVVDVCAGDLGIPAYRKFDLEAWIPSQKRYREVTSCSNCLDWQAMRLSIRYKEKPTDQPQFVHTVNATAVAIGRTLIAILENNQQKDGSVLIPKVLQKYSGFGKILPKT